MIADHGHFLVIPAQIHALFREARSIGIVIYRQLSDYPCFTRVLYGLQFYSLDEILDNIWNTNDNILI